MVIRRDAADGPLAPYVACFGEELALLGYSGRAASQHLELLADLSAWLAQEGLAGAELTTSQTARFLGGRRERGYRELTTPVGAGPLLDYLIGLGIVPLPARPAPAGPADALLERYREYLVSQRGLTEGEVARHAAVASLFVGSAVPASGTGWAGVTAGDVTRFLVRECGGRSRASACKLVSELRSFLRFAQLDGCTALPLSQAVPPVATWTASSLPRWVPAEQVAALLASCDRQRPAGRRDFAILTVLVRLGLRAGEVAALHLADIHWRAGEVLVHGKGRREEKLPLPADAGEAVADY
ncbi:MAG: tyrosine-type recombinase/integrase, partial [Mycobacterium sp.]